ncbi:MAG: hypothetical protein A2V50_08010 [Bacteroidetes bacterium RBG_19FT_COMBO_42_10]|nr:MAG: hypothetical protein A2V50_08010 [Bacteroidetes bacterium RBG_19FT_COMBO_42_10]OFY67838.1 MAG: hypothetical protein A2V64_01225 [Bacteroidetes bacterium RBG_13_43_22]
MPKKTDCASNIDTIDSSPDSIPRSCNNLSRIKIFPFINSTIKLTINIIQDVFISFFFELIKKGRLSCMKNKKRFANDLI